MLAHRIANGHAYAKHAGEFSDMTVAEFEELVYTVIISQSDFFTEPRGRVVYWSDEWRMIVVHEPSHRDAGTAFRPKDGKDYFLALRSRA